MESGMTPDDISRIAKIINTSMHHFIEERLTVECSRIPYLIEQAFEAKGRQEIRALISTVLRESLNINLSVRSPQADKMQVQLDGGWDYIAPSGTIWHIKETMDPYTPLQITCKKRVP